MKKSKFYPLYFLSLFFSLAMLFFTFFAFGWFSDARGFEAWFEIPVGTGNGTLSTIGDCIWMAAPFFLLLSILFSYGKNLFLPAATLPLFLFSILQFCLFAGGKESHFSIIITLSFLLAIGFFALFSPKIPDFGRASFLFAFLHLVTEGILIVLSLIFREKFSQFYFSEILPMGHSGFRYRFFVISVCLYYLSYSLALLLRHLAGEKPEKKISPPPADEQEEEEAEEETEESAPLSLEDFGIER